MTGRLLSEIKQTKPFALPELEAFLNLMRSADTLAREITGVLKPSGLTGAQYNVLRILRGAGEAGLPCGEIGARLVTHDPDITRLIDKLERRGLVARARDVADRRVVMVRITAAGEALAGDTELSRALNDLHRAQFARFEPAHLTQLIDLLERCRER